MTRARDVSRLITTPPSIYATDTETSSAGYLTQSSASATYQGAPFRNLLINGAMNIYQRGTTKTGLAGNGNGFYTADRWGFYTDNSATYSQTIQTTNPTTTGFIKSLRVTCTATSQQGGLSSFSSAFMFQKIEKQSLSKLNYGNNSAKSLNLSFWVKSSLTGTFIVGFIDYENYKYIARSYTINSADTWERKSVTIPGNSESVNNFSIGSDAGFEVRFWVQVGEFFQGQTLATSWSNFSGQDEYLGTGHTTIGTATNQYLEITGVQLEEGTTSTPFEFKPIKKELDECKRYYRKSFPYQTTPASSYTSTKLEIQGARHQVSDSVGYRSQHVFFDTEMCTSPTIIVYNGSTNSANTMRLYSNTGTTQDITASIYGITPNGFYLAVYTGVSVGTTGLSCMAFFNYTAEAEI